VAESVVDLLEPVQIEHHQSAGTIGCLVGSQYGFQPLVHPVAVGEPGERIIFGQSRVFQLPFIFEW
jgi:hypothetical protein